VAGTPLGNDVPGELARNRVGGKDAGVDVKQFHDEVLYGLGPRSVTMDEVCGQI
jgi:hypothetical protein